MQSGMLWFDNDRKRDLTAKLRRAADYYETKYGRRPTVCVVHPSTLAGPHEDVKGLRLEEANTVLPHHFWLGEEDEAGHRPAA
jgi:hypothetical protein